MVREYICAAHYCTRGAWHSAWHVVEPQWTFAEWVKKWMNEWSLSTPAFYTHSCSKYDHKQEIHICWFSSHSILKRWSYDLWFKPGHFWEWKGCCKWLHQSNWHKLGHFRQTGTYGHSIHLGVQNTGGPESGFLAHFSCLIYFLDTLLGLRQLFWLFELITKCSLSSTIFLFLILPLDLIFALKWQEKKFYEEKQKAFGALFSPPYASPCLTQSWLKKFLL